MGLGLLEEAVGARGTAAGMGSEGVCCDDVGGCGVGCEIGRSNSCPPIIPPCEGEPETWGATPFSGTWWSGGASEVGKVVIYRPAMDHRSSADWVQPGGMVRGCGESNGRDDEEEEMPTLTAEAGVTSNITQQCSIQTIYKTIPYRLSFPVLLSTTPNHCTGWRLNIGQGGSTIYHILAITQHTQVSKAYQGNQPDGCSIHGECRYQRLQRESHNE